MDFFTNAIDVLQTLVIALGGGLCVWKRNLREMDINIVTVQPQG